MTEKVYVELDRELVEYLSSLLGGLGRVERVQALGWYAAGLLLAGERKSIAPMAKRLSPDENEAEAIRQRLQEAVVIAKWDPEVLWQRMNRRLVGELGNLEALIGDDTGIARHGNHCVGTARQYSGTLGRVDRCQVIPSLHAAGPSGSFCLGAQLYLPQSWTDDPARLQKAQVPAQIVFATKWQLMLGLIDRMLGLGLETLPFIGDAGYGDVAEFRRELNARDRPYLLEVMSSTAVWAPGTGPEPPEGPMGKMGRPRTQYHDGEHIPLSVTELVLSQTQETLVEVTWKNGDGPERKGRFGAVRLQPANGHCQGRAPEPEQWLVWEWPEGQELPEHYWLSTLPADTPLERLVYLAKLRWRVERDYQEMKAEVGLDHYEGRTWAGLHHHFVLCSVAHGFLVLQRARWQRQQMAAPASPPGPVHSQKKTAHTDPSVTTPALGSDPAARLRAPAATLDPG
jgi:SRSO17 transposase